MPVRQLSAATRSLLCALAPSIPVTTTPAEIIRFRTTPNLGFARASYELTESCNLACAHCYLGGQKRASPLTLAEKLRLIDFIEKSGCVWLQLTGGEPLTDQHFISVYLRAVHRGLLVSVSSNGVLLSWPHFRRLFVNAPPYRLTISLYGSSPQSYGALTGAPAAFSQVAQSVSWAIEAGIRMRLSIILTTYNAHEEEKMVEFAKGLGVEYYVYKKLTPTITGDASPLCLQQEPSSRPHNEGRNPPACMAGRSFYHIDTAGMASICKISRLHQTNLVQDGIDSLMLLAATADAELAIPDSCTNCTSADSCSMCGPERRLYIRASGSCPFCADHSNRKGGDDNGNPVFD